MFNMSKEDLKNGTLCRIAEIEIKGTPKTVMAGHAIRKEFLYDTPSREVALAQYNYGIQAYRLWQQGKLTLFISADGKKLYSEITDKELLINETRGTFDMSIFFEETNEKEWKISFSNEPPAHIKGIALAILGGAKMELFDEVVKKYDGSERENHPGFFCDAIFSGFCSENDFTGEVISSDAISEKFALADLSSYFGGDIFTADTTTETEELDAYWTWESCLKGEHRIDYDWAPEAKEHIPSLSVLEAFVPTKDFINMLVILENGLSKIKKRMDDGLTGEEAIDGDSINLKLAGPPGAGKSFALKCAAAVLGMPFWVTSFNPNSDESFAEGKTRMVGAEPRHTDAPLTLCQMYGGISAGEEPNTGDPEMIFGVYSQIVESPYTLYRNGCEKIVRHPLAVYALLYNKNCGSATMHPALLNRFNQPFEFEAADENTFINMLMSASKAATIDTKDINEYYNSFAQRRKAFRKTPKMVCKWVYKAYEKIMNNLLMSSGRDAAEAISLRSCVGTIKAIEAGEDPISALRCLLDNIGDFDEELYEATCKSVESTMVKL